MGFVNAALTCSAAALPSVTAACHRGDYAELMAPAAELSVIDGNLLRGDTYPSVR
jgi:hypothetical protein